MTKNMGTIDRSARTLVAVALLALVAAGLLEGTWRILAIVVAVLFLPTSAVGFCPAYWPFKVRTRGRSE